MNTHLAKPLALVLSVSAGTFLAVAGYVESLRAEAQHPDEGCSRQAVAPCEAPTPELEPAACGDREVPLDPAACTRLEVETAGRRT